MNLVLPIPHFRILFHRPVELRIDVDLSTTDRDESLAATYERIRSPGDRLRDLPVFGLRDPHLKICIREADGEFYAYVEDVQRRCLAGCTVFNRLVEAGRRADRHLRSPHSRYLAHYRRRGIVAAVYEWALGTGFCLMTGARQSAGAHALWLSLGRRYESGFSDLRDKKLPYLGRDLGLRVLDRLQTRMFFAGPGVVAGTVLRSGRNPVYATLKPAGLSAGRWKMARPGSSWLCLPDRGSRYSARTIGLVRDRRHAHASRPGAAIDLILSVGSPSTATDLSVGGVFEKVCSVIRAKWLVD